MKNSKNYLSPEIEIIILADVIMSSGQWSDEGDGGYVPDKPNWQ